MTKHITSKIKPGLFHEEKAWAISKRLLGIDEAGYGAFAGSLFVAGVIMPVDFKISGKLEDVKDSKKCEPHMREKLEPLIKAAAAKWFVLEITVDQINKYSPYYLKYDGVDELLKTWAEDDIVTLYDGNKSLSNHKYQNDFLIQGDAQCFSIAAASILAKRAKDVEMAAMEIKYPGYGFGDHYGYFCEKHKEALKTLGPCPIHRTQYIKNWI